MNVLDTLPLYFWGAGFSHSLPFIRHNRGRDSPNITAFGATRWYCITLDGLGCSLVIIWDCTPVESRVGRGRVFQCRTSACYPRLCASYTHTYFAYLCELLAQGSCSFLLVYSCFWLTDGAICWNRALEYILNKLNDDNLFACTCTPLQVLRLF